MAQQTYQQHAQEQDKEYLIAGENSGKVQLGCCGQCSRFIVKWSNLILSLCGFALIGLACYQLWKGEGDAISEWVGKDMSYWIVGLGSLIVVLSCCGWCSSRNQSICGLMLYSLVLFLIIVGEIVIAVMFILHESDLKTYLQDLWNDLPVDDQAQIEHDLDCSGFDDCYKEVKDDVHTYQNVVTIIMLGIVAYQIFLLTLSCCLMKEIRLGREQESLNRNPHHNVRSSYAGVYA